MRFTTTISDSPYAPGARRHRMRRRTVLIACGLLFLSLVPTAEGVRDPAVLDPAAQGEGPPENPVNRILGDLFKGEESADQADGNTPDPPADSSSGNEDRSSEPYVHVGVDNRVTMHPSSSGLPLADALHMLSAQSKRNIILTDGVSGTANASLYNVTFEEALNALLVANGLGYRARGKFIYVYPLEDLARIQQSERKIATRVIRLNYMNAAAVSQLVTPLLSETGTIQITPPSKVGLGGEAGPEDTEGDTVVTNDIVILTDYVKKLNEIEKVIQELDVFPRQVLIEATILRATLNEDNALGIDFTTLGGIDFGTVNSVSPGAQSITTGNIPNALLNDTSFTVRTDFNANVPGGGFTFGVIKDQIGFFIRALESVTDTDVLANPKVLALNKNPGQIIVGRRDGYITTTITETTAVQTVEFLETGTILTFRPFIGDDGYVRMEIHPKDSTGGLTQANLPFEQTTEVTTNVMVKDGHTILIGGLFREVNTETRGQVPLLGNIPIAGALFRSTQDTTVREEVIVLLTVHIIKGEADTQASSELEEDVERFRVGMREGMQWFGRERLAQTHYAWALQHLEAGDLDKALWDAKIAVHNFPRHIHAFKLIEKIRGRRTWESEASSIRNFVRDRIQEESGTIQPSFGRPALPFSFPEGFDEKTGKHPRKAAE